MAMSLEVYYQQDVARILTALASAGDRYGPEYHKALADVALAFGLKQPPVATVWHLSCTTSTGRVVEAEVQPMGLDSSR
jgi:hypothetical protein